jgi:Uma2 family endonuclease
MTAMTLALEPVFTLNNEQFQQLCVLNPELQLERTAKGELVIMPPTGGETGRQNAQLIFQVQLWNQQYQLGEVFDSSTGFILPNGATRSPDVSWVEKSRWEVLTPEQRERFIPLCPDFVIELVSPSDSVQKTRLKMEEYRDNGCGFGILVNRKDRRAEIYRSDYETETLSFPIKVLGKGILKNLELDLT